MKKLLVTFFALIIFSSLINNCEAQWQSDFRLTNNPSTSSKTYNDASSIATNGNYVHIVWYDYRDDLNPEIYYKRSTDGGITWGADTRLTYDPAGSANPTLAVSGTVVHVVWYDSRTGSNKIFYKRSTDNGSNWGGDIQLSFGPDASQSAYPSITLNGSVLHVVWRDDRDGNNEIYYKRSTDNGSSWGGDTRLTNDPGYSSNPSVSVSGSVVNVIWQEDRDGNGEIYNKRSTDGGTTWGPDTRLTINAAESHYPSSFSSGSFVYVVWQDVRDANYEIYFKRSTDGGATWGADSRLTFSAFNSFWPSVQASGNNIHVTWSDVRDANWEIYYKQSTDGGITWGADTRLTNDIGNSYYPSISVSGTILDIVWQDDRDGNFEMYYKRNPTGNPLGITPISSQVPAQFSLEQNYPNPFNPNSKIKFQIAKLSNAKLSVFGALGNEVETLVNEQLQPGTYEVSFDGSKLASGIYFYKLAAETFTETKKMILIK